MAPALTHIAVDGHVHVYPHYDVPKVLSCLLNSHIPATTTCVGLLAESRTCHFYQDMAKQGAAFNQGSLRLEAGPDEGAITIRENDLIKGYLIAGRQIVTTEKLEILGLGADVSVADGQTAEATIQAIRAQGAVPVLSWSPGKWFFKRGEKVLDLITTHKPGDFLIGDTGLRPTLWPLPRLMRLARERGYAIIGGSDPLPLPGEECRVGTYGMTVQAPFDPARPAASLRRILSDPTTRYTPAGHRSPPIPFLFRWINNQFYAKRYLK